MTTTKTRPARPARHRPTPATSPGRGGPRRAAAPRPRRRWVGWGALVLTGVAAFAAVAVGGRNTPAAAGGDAPAFRLASTAGGEVSLADYRGRNVLLYFNEGVGCDVCFVQTAKLEADGGLTKAGVPLVPVVMNPVGQVQTELRRFGLQEPYLVDPGGSVSKEYKTLGTGHHADRPGHTFVLVGPDGRIRWRGDYPGMWVEPAQLAKDVLRNIA